MGKLVAWFDRAQQGELHPLIAFGILIVTFLKALQRQTRRLRE